MEGCFPICCCSSRDDDEWGDAFLSFRGGERGEIEGLRFYVIDHFSSSDESQKKVIILFFLRC